MRIMVIVVLALLAPVSVGLAAELRIAAWKLEHLDDTESEGCIGRTGICACRTVESRTYHGHRLYRSNFELMYCPTRSAAASTSRSPRWA